jgi:hypothetical protein
MFLPDDTVPGPTSLEERAGGLVPPVRFTSYIRRTRGPSAARLIGVANVMREFDAIIIGAGQAGPSLAGLLAGARYDGGLR